MLRYLSKYLPTDNSSPSPISFDVSSCYSVVKWPQIQQIQGFLYFISFSCELTALWEEGKSERRHTWQLSPFSVITDCNFVLHLRYTRPKFNETCLMWLQFTVTNLLKLFSNGRSKFSWNTNAMFLLCISIFCLPEFLNFARPPPPKKKGQSHLITSSGRHAVSLTEFRSAILSWRRFYWLRNFGVELGIFITTVQHLKHGNIIFLWSNIKVYLSGENVLYG